MPRRKRPSPIWTLRTVWSGGWRDGRAQERLLRPVRQMDLRNVKRRKARPDLSVLLQGRKTLSKELRFQKGSWNIVWLRKAAPSYKHSVGGDL